MLYSRRLYGLIFTKIKTNLSGHFLRKLAMKFRIINFFSIYGFDGCKKLGKITIKAHNENQDKESNLVKKKEFFFGWPLGLCFFKSRVGSYILGNVHLKNMSITIDFRFLHI
jgi:hypothetical protein